MGYYYTEGPPEKESRWKKYIPRWLKQFWADTEEVLMVTRVTFSIILPVFGVLVGFVVLCFLGILLLNFCSARG